jgi:hypothetical protein
MTDKELTDALSKAPDWKMARLKAADGQPAAPEGGPQAKEAAFRERLRAEKAARDVIAKPETTLTLRRIPVRDIPAGHEIRTIILSEAQGIKALEDVTDHQIATYLFDKTKWTMEAAQAWVDSHMQKRALPAADFIRDMIEEDAAWLKAHPEPTEKRAWPAKRAFFRIMKVDPAQQICGGIIYEPNAVDTQGDMTTAEEITKAMYGFMEKYAQNPNRIKVMHKGKAFYFPILESYQPEADVKKGKDIIKAGSWWMMIKVTDPEIWADVQSGKLTGFSMGGTARKASTVWGKKAN